MIKGFSEYSGKLFYLIKFDALLLLSFDLAHQ